MSYFNRIKETEIQLPNVGIAIGGEYRIEAFKGFEFPRGSGIVWEYPFTRHVLADWFENIVTDFGLENYGVNRFGLDFCHVGTGNTPETATDTQLDAFVAGVADNDQTFGAQATPPYFGHTVFKYRFLPNFGGGAVNLNEVGVGGVITAGELSSRALTVDGAGSPLTISVLADEYLDVYYKRRNYPAHLIEATGVPTDLTGSIDVSGTSYGYTIRPMFVTLGGSRGTGTSHAWGTGLNVDFNTDFGFAHTIFAKGVALDETATLGAVTAGPSGGISAATAEGRELYTNNSYKRELWYQWGPDNANFSVGIGGLIVKTTLGAYQIVFDTPIPKVDPETFTYWHQFSWTRKTTWV